jgi:uncharacterized membrane protein
MLARQQMQQHACTANLLWAPFASLPQQLLLLLVLIFEATYRCQITQDLILSVLGTLACHAVALYRLRRHAEDSTDDVDAN